MLCCQYASHPTLSFWRKVGLRAEIGYEMCLEMSLILKPNPVFDFHFLIFLHRHFKTNQVGAQFLPLPTLPMRGRGRVGVNTEIGSGTLLSPLYPWQPVLQNESGGRSVSRRNGCSKASPSRQGSAPPRRL